MINSPETVAAVEFMAKLFKETMTDEVFSWNAASNNQGLVAGKLSLHPQLDLGLAHRAGAPTPTSPTTSSSSRRSRARRRRSPPSTCCTTGSSRSTPANPDAAKEFLLHYTANFAAATYDSQAVRLPAPGPSSSPSLDGWLANDPFGAKPAGQARVPHGRDRSGAPTSATPARPARPTARSSAPSSSRTCSPARPAASRRRSRRSPTPRRRSSRSSTSGATQGLVGG